MQQEHLRYQKQVTLVPLSVEYLMKKLIDFMQSCCSPLGDNLGMTVMTSGQHGDDRDGTGTTGHPQCHPYVPIIPISQDYIRLHEISPEIFSI